MHTIDTNNTQRETEKNILPRQLALTLRGPQSTMRTVFADGEDTHTHTVWHVPSWSVCGQRDCTDLGDGSTPKSTATRPNRRTECSVCVCCSPPSLSRLPYIAGGFSPPKSSPSPSLSSHPRELSLFPTRAHAHTHTLSAQSSHRIFYSTHSSAVVASTVTMSMNAMPSTNLVFILLRLHRRLRLRFRRGW